MARGSRVLGFVTAAIAAAVIFFLIVVLPANPERLTSLGDPDLEGRTVPGAFHVHTTRSDGTADKATVARAAARAGLKFAVFADHGDGTGQPDAPSYIDGVLCLDAVEISTDEGHYIALDMPVSPYPLGGAGASVVEDVKRLGGFGVAAHPDSPKAPLRWREDVSPIDGVEWLSADSEWRDESRPRLARAVAEYVFRPAPALASLLDRPTITLARWDRMSRERAVVAVAGHDAHGGIGGAAEDGQRRWLARTPSYEAAFRSMSTRVIADARLTGDALADTKQIVGAFRDGRVFTAIDAVAAPAVIDFRVRAGGRELQMGESATFEGAGQLRVRSTAPSGARVVLLGGGQEIAAADGGHLEQDVTAPGAYRVEVRAPRAPGTPPVPWLLTNPIYLRPPVVAASPTIHVPDVVLPLKVAWHVEHDPESTAALTATNDAVQLEYQLRSGERASQFVALAGDLPPSAPAFDTVMFTGRASGPMRVSVQFRFRTRGDERWVRSVYLAESTTPAVVRFADMVPAGGTASSRPDPREATSVLFVIDLTNAAPGRAGWFSIGSPALGR